MIKVSSGRISLPADKDKTHDVSSVQGISAIAKVGRLFVPPNRATHASRNLLLREDTAVPMRVWNRRNLAGPNGQSGRSWALLARVLHAR